MPYIPNTIIRRSPATPGVFYVTDYGGSFDGTGAGATDNTTPIQNALNAAAAWNPQANATFHGAVVQLPAGIGKITGKLTMQYGVWLRGYGPGATVIYCQNWNVNADPAILVDTTNMAAKLSDFGLIFGTVSPVTAHGIVVQNGLAYEQTMGVITTQLERVIIKGPGGDGIQLAGVENRIYDCVVRCTGNGFNVTATDAFLANCTADTCGGAGFLLSTSNTKLANCKAFGCTGSGFNVNGQRNMLSSCEAQDNGAYGFNDPQGDNTFASCVADTNGTAGGTAYGFHLSGASCASACLAINRSGTPQDYGFFTGVANSVYPSVVGCTSRLPGTNHVDPASIGSIEVNGLYGAQSVAFSTPLTPDPYAGGTVVVGTLTAPITINATSFTPFLGMKMGFQFTQDSTGRVVTFDSVYKTSAAIATTASSVTRIQFEFDGTNWRETGRAVTA